MHNANQNDVQQLVAPAIVINDTESDSCNKSHSGPGSPELGDEQHGPDPVNGAVTPNAKTTVPGSCANTPK